MAHPHWSLGYLAENEYRLWASCNGCTHFFNLDWAEVIDRFGADTKIVGMTKPIESELICPKCRGLDLEVRIAPPVSSLGGTGKPQVW